MAFFILSFENPGQFDKTMLLSHHPLAATKNISKSET